MNRIWLIGNGASLKRTPLELLKDEKTMGVNKIAALPLPFPITYYVKVDHARFDADGYESQIMPHVGKSQLLLWDAFRDGDATQEISGMGNLPNTTWISRCQKHHYYSYPDDKAAISWHLPELCTAINSINIMAQWAVLLGYDEIYLVGCDGIYTNGKDDHFREDYFVNVDSAYQQRNTTNVLHAHKVIKRSSPIPVYNATVGGSLEIHPRVNFYETLKGKEHA